MLTIATDKEVYRQGELITFTIRNNGFRPLEFPNLGLGLRIINADTGEYVRLDRIYPQTIHYMYPFIEETTSWDQTQRSATSLEHEPVDPGNYVASVRTAGGFEPKTVAEVKFRIS